MDKLSLMLQFFESFLQRKVESLKLKLGEYKSSKAQLYQLYFVLNRFDEFKFIKMDYMTNFGVSFKTKNQLEKFFEEGGTQKDFDRFFEKVEMKESLLAFKYFFWADKKLHHVSYTENKEDIDEDLLCDFLGQKKRLKKTESMI